jgi:hypothetical protein
MFRRRTDRGLGQATSPLGLSSLISKRAWFYL